MNFKFRCFLELIFRILSFDLTDISGGRKSPPKAEKLVPYHVEIVKQTMEKYPGHPLVLAGKSMGSR